MISGPYRTTLSIADVANVADRLSAAGAKVLKDDAVEYARRLGVRIAAGSSSSGLIGTIVSSENLNRDTLQAMVYNDRLRWVAFGAGVPLPPERSALPPSARSSFPRRPRPNR